MDKSQGIKITLWSTEPTVHPSQLPPTIHYYSYPTELALIQFAVAGLFWLALRFFQKGAMLLAIHLRRLARSETRDMTFDKGRDSYSLMNVGKL